jgi:hypothetical protein
MSRAIPMVRKGWRPKGFDWTELGKAFGVDWDGEDEPRLEKELQAILQDISSELTLGTPSKEAKAGVRAVRRFVQKLSKKAARWGYSAPVWEGVGKVKDDWTFIQFVSHLLTWMWT